MPIRGTTEEITLDASRYRVSNYKTDELEALATQIRSGLLTPADRSNEFISNQPTWHLGFGLQEIRDISELGRYHYAQGIDARFRAQLTLGPELASTTFTANAEAKVQFIEFNGSWFAIGARYVHKYNTGTTQWDVDKDMGAASLAQKNCAVVFASSLYVGTGSLSIDFWVRDTAGVWTQPAAGIKATQFALIGNTLWRVFSGNQLSSSTNGTTWTTAVSVGDALNQATLLTDYNGNPLVGKPEGLFEYDGTKVSNRLPELAYRLSSENCRGGKPSRGKLYLPVGPSLWTYTADAIQTEAKPTRSAEVLAPGPSSRDASTEVRGSIKEVWPDLDFLWGIFAAQSGTYYLMAYDFNPTPGQGWHQVAKTGTTAVTAIGRWDSTGTDPRVWYSEGTTIKYFLLPKNSINPYADTTYRYGLTGDIYLPVEADAFDDVSKAYLSLKFEVDNVSASRYVDISFALDGGVDTSLIRVVSSGLNTVFFPSTTQGRRIQLHLHFVTADATQSPRVLPYSRHYQLRFERKKKWTFNIEASRLSAPNIGKDELRQLQAVESSRDAVLPVSFVDLDGRSWTVFVTKIGNLPLGIDAQNKSWSIPVELLEWRSGGGVFSYNSETQIYDARAIWSTGSDAYAAYYS